METAEAEETRLAAKGAQIERDEQEKEARRDLRLTPTPMRWVPHVVKLRRTDAATQAVRGS